MIHVRVDRSLGKGMDRGSPIPEGIFMTLLARFGTDKSRPGGITDIGIAIIGIYDQDQGKTCEQEEGSEEKG